MQNLWGSQNLSSIASVVAAFILMAKAMAAYFYLFVIFFGIFFCPPPTPSPTHSPTKPPPPTVWVNDNYCVAASGPWPAGSVSQIKGSQIADGASNGSYVTCFTDMVGGYCWSHSYNYNNNGDWKPCTPYGGGWETYSPMTGRIDSYTAYGPPITIFTLSPVATCGTACTEFSSDVFQ